MAVAGGLLECRRLPFSLPRSAALLCANAAHRPSLRALRALGLLPGGGRCCCIFWAGGTWLLLPVAGWLASVGRPFICMPPGLQVRDNCTSKSKLSFDYSCTQYLTQCYTCVNTQTLLALESRNATQQDI